MDITTQTGGKKINFDLLYQEIKSASSPYVQNISLADEVVWLEFSDETPEEIIKLALQTIAEHDGQALTESQASDQKKLERLNALRQAVGAAQFSEDQLASLEEPYKTMALKIELLELELLALRGLLA
jgi:hypothetical protein